MNTVKQKTPSCEVKMNESLTNDKIPIKIIVIQTTAVSDVFKSWN